MLLRRIALARALIELAEAEVTVGDEGAHAKLDGERQRLPVEAFGVVRTRCRCDVTREAEGVGLACPSPSRRVSARASRARPAASSIRPAAR